MKRILLIVLCAFLCLGYVSCSGSEKTSDPEASVSSGSVPEETVSKESSSEEISTEENVSEEESEVEMAPIDILFVGNSFTYYNDMPVIFENISKSAGVEINVKSVTVGSSRLEYFNDPNQEISKAFTQALEEYEYEYVFLQEHSTRPYKNYDEFSNGITVLTERIKEKSPNAEIILYETWGFNENYSSLKEEGMTTKDQEILLFDAYEKAGKEHSLTVSNAGVTHYLIYKETEYDPYHTDLKHPSYIGSFSAALTHYYTVFPSASKESVTFAGELSEDVFNTLRDIAYSVVHDENTINKLKGE